MVTTGSISTEFQKRRKATWNAIRYWLVMGFVAFVSLIVLVWDGFDPLGDKQLRIGLLVILVLAVRGLAV
jgi:hypothetical protein